MPYQSGSDFPVDVMMNQFDLSNWNYNDDLDLYECIDLIKDYYDKMTDRLRRRKKKLPAVVELPSQVTDPLLIVKFPPSTGHYDQHQTFLPPKEQIVTSYW